MKIIISDIDHVINQIKAACFPQDKESFKILNNLKILLEKNTEDANSIEKETLTEELENLNESFLELCFLRKDLVNKFSEDFFDVISEIMSKLKEKKNKENKKEEIEEFFIDWKLNADCTKTCFMVSKVFNKIKKTREIIDESINDAKCTEIEGNNYIDSYFNSL